jgi:hypothetical protein
MPSGLKLTTKDYPVVLGMSARGDRDHDIAAWFGVNQGRVAEVKDKYGPSTPPAAQNTLPPKGPPGVKGRKLRQALESVIKDLSSNDTKRMLNGLKNLNRAADAYDTDET